MSGGWRSQGCLVTFSATLSFACQVSSNLKSGSHKHNHRLTTFSYVKQAQGNKAYASAVTLEEIWKYSRWRMKCLCLPHVGSQAQTQGMEKVSFLALTLMLISCRFPHDCSYAYAYACAYRTSGNQALGTCSQAHLFHEFNGSEIEEHGKSFSGILRENVFSPSLLAGSLCGGYLASILTGRHFARPIITSPRVWN